MPELRRCACSCGRTLPAWAGPEVSYLSESCFSRALTAGTPPKGTSAEMAILSILGSVTDADAFAIGHRVQRCLALLERMAETGRDDAEPIGQAPAPLSDEALAEIRYRAQRHRSVPARGVLRLLARLDRAEGLPLDAAPLRRPPLGLPRTYAEALRAEDVAGVPAGSTRDCEAWMRLYRRLLAAEAAIDEALAVGVTVALVPHGEGSDMRRALTKYRTTYASGGAQPPAQGKRP